MNRQQRKAAERQAGKAGNDDGVLKEVPIGMRVGGDFKTNRVLLQFNQQVTNLNLPTDGARFLAAALIEWADKVTASAASEAEVVEPSRIMLPPGVRDQ